MAKRTLDKKRSGQASTNQRVHCNACFQNSPKADYDRRGVCPQCGSADVKAVQG